MSSFKVLACRLRVSYWLPAHFEIIKEGENTLNLMNESGKYLPKQVISKVDSLLTQATMDIDAFSNYCNQQE